MKVAIRDHGVQLTPQTKEDAFQLGLIAHRLTLDDATRDAIPNKGLFMPYNTEAVGEEHLKEHIRRLEAELAQYRQHESLEP